MADNKNKKYGRTKKGVQNMSYKATNRWLTNKLKRIKRTLKVQPNNTELADRLAVLLKTRPLHR